jgi:hypothetical protein
MTQFRFNLERDINELLDDAHIIIDFLSDKTLSLGCIVQNKNNLSLGDLVIVYKNEGSPDEYVAMRGKTELYSINKSDMKIIGHPVYLHDALIKMRQSDLENVRSPIRTLALSWQYCGLNKSLNDIVKERKIDFATFRVLFFLKQYITDIFLK